MAEKTSEQGAEMRGFCLGFEKEIKKKSSSIQVIHMTINRNEVNFEPEFCIPSHQIRQAVLLYLLCIKNRSKPKSKARQRESDLKGAPLAVFRHSEMELVQCISQPLCRPGGVRVTLPHGDPLQ